MQAQNYAGHVNRKAGLHSTPLQGPGAGLDTGRLSPQQLSALENPRPPLRSTRELRRAIRAAEMAAWEATPPCTIINDSAQGPDLRAAKPQRIPRLPGLPTRKRGISGEDIRFLVITLCAAVSLIVGMNEMFHFLAGWSSFVEGIHRLLG